MGGGGAPAGGGGGGAGGSKAAPGGGGDWWESNPFQPYSTSNTGLGAGGWSSNEPTGYTSLSDRVRGPYDAPADYNRGVDWYPEQAGQTGEQQYQAKNEQANPLSKADAWWQTPRGQEFKSKGWSPDLSFLG